MTLQNKSNQLYGKATQQDDTEVVDLFDRYDATIGEGRVADTVTPPKKDFFSSDIEGHVEMQQTVTPIMQEAIFAQDSVEPLQREETASQERQWEKELTATMRMQQDVAQEPIATEAVMPSYDQNAPESMTMQVPSDADVVLQGEVAQASQEPVVLQADVQLAAEADDKQDMVAQPTPEIMDASTPVMTEEYVSADVHTDVIQTPQEAEMDQISVAPSASVTIESVQDAPVVESHAQEQQMFTAEEYHAPEMRPSYIAAAQQAEKPSDLRQRIDLGKKTIAIVDDDVDTREMYAAIFENADYNVIQASDGLEALSLIAQHTPHAIFTGLVMPRMDGFAMIEALKKNPRTADIPVIINSHLGRDSDKQRAEELGVRDFIVRGFTSPRESVERVGAILLRDDYTFRFDINDPDARKLLKDLGDNNFFVCPRGQEMVLKLRISDPKNMIFSARFSCMDAPRDK